jgi:NAD(P)-dependent dehydrogenase (short-subunit alcohol dehydrogenase family)
MMDANGCNTTAAATVAAIVGAESPRGKRAVVLAGTGPVGLRVAELLAREGARVIVIPPWRELLGNTWNADRAARDAAQTATAGGKAGFEVRAIDSRDVLAEALADAAIAVSAGPLGVNVLREQDWGSHRTLRILVDLNPLPPLGIEGIKASDVQKTRSDRIVFGALGLGGLKMKVHKACVAKLFEARDKVFDAVAVYEVARSVLG